MSGAVPAAFAAGALAVTAAGHVLALAGSALARLAPEGLRAAGRLAAAAVRTGGDGREPGAAERRRLLVLGGIGALVTGTLVAGPRVGAVLAAAGPWLAGRALRSRRERYRRRVAAGAPAVALALAGALGGGHSLRAAVAHAAGSVPGPAGGELRRTARELALGATTDQALEALRGRVRSHAFDTIVAAALLQRRAGGDLALLLRDCARGFEDHARLEGEVRAATAQARFTGALVAVLPLGAALLAELASPGYLAGLARSFLTAWLAGIALVLQLVAWAAIRRLGRVRW